MTAGARRSLALLTTAGTTAGLLLGGVTGASAATTTFNHLSTNTVLTALPSSASLPKGVKLAGKIAITPAASATPCGTATPKVALAGASEVAAVYSDGKPTAANVSVWTVEAAVFTTNAKAEAAAVMLAAAETKCKAKVSEEGITLTRTVAAPDTSEKGLWKGFRTVSHLTDAKAKASLRVWTTWFFRGNVLIEVTEEAPITTSSQATQDALRKAVTVATLTKLDTAAA